MGTDVPAPASAPNPRSTRFDIDTIAPRVTPSEFFSRYYLPQVPVVVAGIALHWRASRLWTPEYVRQALGNVVVEKSYNFDIAEDHALARDCDTPPHVAYVRSRRPVNTRPEPLRIWISGRRTHTRWHFDGNSLQVFNVQIRGRKRFSLISPETPLPTFGFGQGARAGYADLAEIRVPIRFTVCDLAAGDMIFIPQHWYHSVLSLDEENLNVNWVWTDPGLAVSSTTVTAIREREYLAGLYLMATWMRRLGWSPAFQRYVEEYGGAPPFALAREFYGAVSLPGVARRLLVEFGRTLRDGRYRRRNNARELELNEGLRRTAHDFFEKRQQRQQRGPAVSRSLERL